MECHRFKKAWLASIEPVAKYSGSGTACLLCVTSSCRTSAGFSLVELIVVLAITAILASFAVPSFQELSRNSRMTSTVNELLSHLYIARSESIKRGLRVTLCKSTDGSTCTTSANTYWENGWIVFLDINSDAQRNPAVYQDIDGDNIHDSDEPFEDLIAVRSPINQWFTVRGTTDSVKNYVSYVPNGGIQSITGTPQTGVIQFCDARKDSAKRGVHIFSTGRPRVVAKDSAQVGTCP